MAEKMRQLYIGGEWVGASGRTFDVVILPRVNHRQRG